MYEYKFKLNRQTRRPFLVKEREIEYSANNRITCPDEIFEFLNRSCDIGNLAEEHVFMLALNVRGSILGLFEISHGTTRNSVCEPREVFSRALMVGAVSIVLAHNHPSGDPTISQEDYDLTKRMIEAGRIIGVDVLDHITIADNAFCSIRETNLDLFR